MNFLGYKLCLDFKQILLVLILCNTIHLKLNVVRVINKLYILLYSTLLYE